MIGLKNQCLELCNKYTGLKFELQSNNSGKIWGILLFKTTILNFNIKDYFNIEILIPENYPNTLPKTIETHNKIPQCFHRNPDRTLCLATNFEVRSHFNILKNLTGYVENCLIPYLASFAYWQKYKIVPYGERKHGVEGIIETYQEVLNINDEKIILGLLKILSENNYRGHDNCVCNNGNKLRNCHGKNLINIIEIQTQEEFFNDYEQVFRFLRSKYIDIPQKYISDKLINKISSEIDKNKQSRVPPLL